MSMLSLLSMQAGCVDTGSFSLHQPSHAVCCLQSLLTAQAAKARACGDESGSNDNTANGHGPELAAFIILQASSAVASLYMGGCLSQSAPIWDDLGLLAAIMAFLYMYNLIVPPAEHHLAGIYCEGHTYQSVSGWFLFYLQLQCLLSFFLLHHLLRLHSLHPEQPQPCRPVLCCWVWSMLSHPPILPHSDRQCRHCSPLLPVCLSIMC